MDLPHDIVKYHLRPYLVYAKSIRSSRLVCKKWRDSLLLPSVNLTRSGYAIRFLYPELLLPTRPELEPQQLFRATKSVSMSFGDKHPAFPFPTIMTDLASNITVTSLDMPSNLIDDALVQLLSASKTIKRLDLRACAFKSLHHNAIFFDGLAANKTLRTLILSRTHAVIPCTLKNFTDCFKSTTTITSLNLSGCMGGDPSWDVFAQILRTNCSLKYLNLSSVDWLTSTHLVEIAKAIQFNSTLTTLDLSLTSGPAALSALAEALQTNTTLNKLIFDSNEASIGSARDFAATLRRTTTLQNLSMRKCTGDGFDLIGDAFSENKSVKILNFESTLASHEAHDGFADALATNSSLTDLNVRMCDFTSTALLKLMLSLRKNETLTRINLSAINLFDDDLFPALFEALKVNTTLTDLHVRGCLIGSIGALQFVELLQVNSTLRIVTLAGNLLGESGSQTIFAAMEGSTSVISLDMGSNQLGPEGAFAAARVIEKNTTLQRLNISNNGLFGPELVSIIEALKFNSTLSHLNISINPGTTAVEKLIQTTTTKANTFVTIDC